MEFILGLLILICLSKIARSNKSNYFSAIDNHKFMEEKWAHVLDFSSNTCPSIPVQDRSMVAILYEQSEQYCRRHNLPNNEFLLEIRQNYKTTTYDFN